MRKSDTFIFVTLIVALCLCALISCNKEKEHCYTDWIAEIPASCKDGTLGHYTCSLCGKNFNIEKKELASLRIPAVSEHSFSVNGKCSVCGTKKASEGLSFKLSSQGAFYIVTGIGVCTDKNIVIPSTYEGLQVIAYEAFSNLQNLTEVSIPDSVTVISDYAFFGCTALTSVNLGSQVASVGKFAFSNCEALTSITIQNSLIMVDEFAFYNAKSIKNVYYIGTEKNWDSIFISKGNDDLKSATKHFNYVPQ